MILRIVRRGMDREEYNRLRELLDIDHDHPLGLIVHGASEVDGLMQVAQIWDGPEYAEAFDRDRLAPALRAAGITGRSESTTFELEHLVTP